MIEQAEVASGDVLKPKLYLCKPNRQVIAILNDAYDISQDLKLGAISQLDFKLPYEKDVHHQLERNQHVDLLKNRYLIKFVKGSDEEWYLIVNPEDTMDEDKDYKQVHGYGLGYELTDKLIRSYSVVSYTATRVLKDLLKSTLWSPGYVHASFDTMYRSLDISSKNVNDALIEAAEKFHALLIYDTVHRKIHFYQPDQYGVDQRFSVSYGKLLRSASVQQNTDDFCTRLKVFGKDGISIAGVNPTGTNYVEDYSFFIAPFARDEQRKVLSHSAYMSDSLCHALLDYQIMVQSKNGQYKELTEQQSQLQRTRTEQDNELTTLQNELAVLEDQISVANANNQSTSSLVTQKKTKQQQITNQRALLEATDAQFKAAARQISALQAEIAVESNFSPDQITEWNQYTIEKELVNDSIDDEQELYHLAVEQFKEYREPKVVAEIEIVNFWECLEEKHNWDKVKLGDMVRIHYEKLGIHIQAKIVEMKFDYESGGVNLTISNVTELLSDEARFLKDLYKSISTSTSVNMNHYKWEQAYSKSNEIYAGIQADFDAAKRTIVASNNESVEISRKGIITRDLNDPDKYVVIQHGLVALTQDNGNTWGAVITPDRIVAERVKGILGEFVKLRANQIMVGDSGEKISDTVISSANYWNSVERSANSYAQTQANQAVAASKAYSDTTLVTSTTYTTQINTAIRNDLRLQAALPTSITMDGNGITASTSDVSKFARLDHRGLYVQNGAVQITSKDGTTVIDGEGITASKIKAGDMYGVNLNIGSGNAIFKANGSGISLGNATFASAPFRVDMAGNLTASKATIQGAIDCTSLSINGTNILNGNLINGNYIDKLYANQIVVGGGTIGDHLIGSSAAWNAKETTSGAQNKADSAYNSAVYVINNKDSLLRSDLRLTAPLPTSITMDSSGIRATTNNGTSYAQLDYRGLYIENGAIKIKNSNGQTFIDGNGIYSTTITGSTIRTAENGSRVIMTSGWADTYWYSGNHILFKIHDGLTQVNIGGDLNIVCSGNWFFNGNVNFSGNVSGVTAKFG
ncbi:phage tail spike protein [Paenibacillus sp. y28]|uniref:phage tail spike protein n=1 Tax=Paenibacillus sp. y28 TaxID=3129110 RepID=UPI003017F6C2